jgi:polyhydroxybutyrate depolymerase
MISRPRRFASSSTAIAALIVSIAAGMIFQPLPAHAAGSGDRSGTIEVGGRTRSYFVHVPPGYTGKTRVPVVLVLHGATQSAAGVARMSGMSRMADRENFLAVYPTGTSRLGLAPTWNAGNCCGYALKNNVDDIGFLRALLNRLQTDYAVDPKRIYATGISNGAMMSYRAACELSDQIAAVAPVEGAQNVPCHPSSPVSVIVFHGTADRLVPFEGGASPFQLDPRRSDTPVLLTVAFWAKQDGCSMPPEHEETPELRIDTYSGCANGAGVALYVIRGGHHIWPGVRMSGNHVPATEIMWRFFVQHPKP